MQTITTRYGAFTRLARLIDALHTCREFTCSDCERWERCGLPPSDTCVVRAAQLERGDWKWRALARALELEKI